MFKGEFDHHHYGLAAAMGNDPPIRATFTRWDVPIGAKNIQAPPQIPYTLDVPTANTHSIQGFVKERTRPHSHHKQHLSLEKTRRGPISSRPEHRTNHFPNRAIIYQRPPVAPGNIMTPRISRGVRNLSLAGR